MKLSPIYVEKLAEREQIGLEKGLQQGLQQEANLLIIRQLNRKFGNLSPLLANRIASLPLKTLEDLGEALLDFNSVEDLINWLENK
jgi:predicted transposase YdaD